MISQRDLVILDGVDFKEVNMLSANIGNALLGGLVFALVIIAGVGMLSGMEAVVKWWNGE